MEKPIRVLHIFNNNNAEVLGPLVENLLTALKSQKVDSHMVYLTTQEHFKGTMDHLTIHKSWDWRFIKDLQRTVTRTQARIIHTHDLFSLANISWPARLIGKKLIHTRHARLEENIHPLMGLLHDKFIACSKDVKTQFLKHCLVPPDKIEVVYDGVPFPKLDNRWDEAASRDLKRKLGIKEDALVLANNGPLVPQEDQATLLKAMRKLVQKKVNVNLLMLGHGPLQSELEKLSEEFKIEGQVHFLGNAQGYQMNPALPLAEIMVFSFNKEIYPLRILEAMALGKPVIANSIGTNVEIVAEAESGFLVPCGFPERLEAAIMRYYANRSLIAKMGDAAFRNFKEKFSIQQMALGYTRIYNQIVKN